MDAPSLLDALEAKRFKQGPFVFLREVRNRTGYGARQRYADALVVSCWPSRGLWFGGIEVKVARSDWLRELEQPEKSTEIQRYCDFWWIASTPGVVREGELPETWGHFEVDGKKIIEKRMAPRLQAEPLSAEFVCSVFRNQQQGIAAITERATFEGYERARSRFDGEAVQRMESKLTEAELERDALKRQVERTNVSIARFEELAGVQIDRYAVEHSAELVRAAAALKASNLGRVAANLADAAEAVLEAQRCLSEET